MNDLVHILKHGFTPRFCLENYSDLFYDSDNELMIAFPMTCFCDLPLSQLHKHLDFYGGYGIGLKKEWGEVREINPVFYVHQKSDFSVCVNFLESLCEADKMSVLRYIKLYDGYVSINGREVYKRFYDEREWRWVDGVSSLTKEEYNDRQKLDEAEYGVSQRVRLDFEPDDIKYVIVSSESEIYDIVEKIETMSDRYSKKDIQLLYTKILCTEHIKADF